jgi:hypothetical protein
MGLRGLFDALTKIAAQPDKDFGDLVRQRRRKRGLPVAPTGKVLPFLPAWTNDDLAGGAALKAAADAVLGDDAAADELNATHLRLAKRRMAEALLALEEVSLGTASAREVAHLEQVFTNEVSVFQALLHDESGS